ncbi:MAG TPA: hypothetical protein DDW87_04965 [Firmicutes bacterium]|nr:hypothetical protein [Bacillota bacterium]
MAGKFLLILSMLVLTLVATTTGTGVSGYDSPLVIAHRGASSLAPENTMAAVYAALDLGVDMVEVDVHRSSDGELVVIHDGTVTRTTNGTGAVNRLTLADLKELDAGSWFDRSFENERIPTLREVLEAVRDKAILLIELKGERTEVRTVELVRELGMSDQVVMQSFDFRQIQKVKEKAPEIPTVFLVSQPEHSSEPRRAAGWMINTAEFVGASGIAVRHNWFTPELLELASEEDLKVFVWTVDEKSGLHKFIKAGVHGIISNRPQDLVSLLD